MAVGFYDGKLISLVPPPPSIHSILPLQAPAGSPEGSKVAIRSPAIPVSGHVSKLLSSDTCPLLAEQEIPFNSLWFASGKPAGYCQNSSAVSMVNGSYFAHIKKSPSQAGKRPYGKGFPFLTRTK